MNKTIVILGTLDTKGEHLYLLKEKIETRKHRALILDLSMGSVPALHADIPAAEIARMGGRSIEQLIAGRDRAGSTEVMIAGAQQKVLELLSNRQLDGIVAMGGASMALMGQRIMAKLPLGIPKVIATPAAMPTYISEWFGSLDVVVMQVIMEFAGMHNLLSAVISQVAGAVSGMVEESVDYAALELPHPSVAITQMGFNEECAFEVKRLLEERGYHVYPFHANGISDRSMESLISQGFLDGLIDIVPAGLIEELFQGNRAAGMDRLDAPINRGIPLVLAPCTFNVTGAGPTRRDKERFINRPRLQIDEIRFMTRYTPDEMRQGARLYAEKLNRATGPVKFLVPLRGWSSIDKPGSLLHNPREDLAFFEELKARLTCEIPIEELDCNLEDREFARALVESFDTIFKEAHR
ncbi:MAG: Tm-1-like ATP-binding domain-containing protein [Syntrophorhabdales bacterium]